VRETPKFAAYTRRIRELFQAEGLLLE
jgi:hypothetical protein